MPTGEPSLIAASAAGRLVEADPRRDEPLRARAARPARGRASPDRRGRPSRASPGARARGRSRGPSGARTGSGSRPTCTWRPRLRSPAIEAAQAASLPIASRLTWAPPPVCSRMSAPAGTASSAPTVARAVQRRLGDVDGDHARPRGRGDHHRRQPDAAAAVDGDPLARAHAADLEHRAVGGREAAAQRRRRVGVQPVRQRDQVHVGPVDPRVSSANEPQCVKPGWVWRSQI